MNKSTIETIQTSTILIIFIAEIIHDKVNWICQMSYKKKLRNGLNACRYRKERFSLLQIL